MKWYIKDGVISKDAVQDAEVFEVSGRVGEITIPDGVACIGEGRSRAARAWRAFTFPTA